VKAEEMSRKTNELLQDALARLARLEHEAELMRTVLIVKEPGSALAADAYNGLRKQVVAAAAERRSHMVQLATMAVAVHRATSVSDLVPQVQEWMAQAGVVELHGAPRGWQAQDLFEDLEGNGLAGAGDIDVVEPAYVDSKTEAVLRLGRARRSALRPDVQVMDGASGTDGVDGADGPPADPAPVVDEEPGGGQPHGQHVPEEGT
jgi:hypothetical protein